MKRFLLITTLCLFGISDAWAAVCNKVLDGAPACSNSKCKDLGYKIGNKDYASKACHGSYFSCPTGGGCYKCDETAAPGDIKYSNKTSSHNGWLLCDGSTFDAAQYPDLACVIGGDSPLFGGSEDKPKLPDYRGMFLRGGNGVRFETVSGTQREFHPADVTNMQAQNLKSHSHPFKRKYFDYESTEEGKQSDTQNIVRGVSATPMFSTVGYANLCPYRVGLNTFIYAGGKAK